MNSDHFLRVGAAVMVLGLLVGCSQSGETNGGDTLPPGSSVSATAPSGPVVSPPATQPPATTAGPAVTAPGGTVWSPQEAEVATAFIEFNDAFHRSAISGDQEDPALSRRAADQVLESIRIDILNRQTRGIRVRPGAPPVNRAVPVSVEITDGQAIVVACVVNNAVVTAADGRVIDNDLATARSKNRLQQRDGVWKVVGREKDGEWPGDEEAKCVG